MHLGIAEAIDGLFRIAHQKNGPSITRFPAAHETLDEFPLVQARILEFIDQEVFDSDIQVKLDVRGGIAIEGAKRGLLQCGKIDHTTNPAQSVVL